MKSNKKDVAPEIHYFGHEQGRQGLERAHIKPGSRHELQEVFQVPPLSLP